MFFSHVQNLFFLNNKLRIANFTQFFLLFTINYLLQYVVYSKLSIRLNSNLSLIAHHWGGRFDRGAGHFIVLHPIVEHRHQWVRWATYASKIIHVDGPSHRPTVSLGLYKVHLNLQAADIFVAHPLVTWRQTMSDIVGLVNCMLITSSRQDTSAVAPAIL